MMAGKTNKHGPLIQAGSEKCTGCLVCELRCSLRFEKAFNPARAKIRIKRLVGAETEFSIAFTDDCDNCGLCVRHCPYGALVQETRKGAA